MRLIYRVDYVRARVWLRVASSPKKVSQEYGGILTKADAKLYGLLYWLDHQACQVPGRQSGSLYSSIVPSAVTRSRPVIEWVE